MIEVREPDDDFRFVIDKLEEPEMGATHIVTVIGIPSGDVLERFSTDDPYSHVEQAREAQAWLEENPGRYLLEREEQNDG